MSDRTDEQIKAEGLREYASYLDDIAHDFADMMTEDDEDENARTMAALLARADQIWSAA